MQGQVKGLAHFFLLGLATRETLMTLTRVSTAVEEATARLEQTEEETKLERQ